MSNIFICYRREDSAGHTGRLYDRLTKRFGPDSIYIDVATIKPGVNFVDAIDQAINNAQIVLVIIGKNWIYSKESESRRPIDDPDDFIHREIFTALQKEKLVIPVLVASASMPPVHSLPDDIQDLARINAIELSDARWDYDIGQLITLVETTLFSENSQINRSAIGAPYRRTIYLAIAVLTVIAITLIVYLSFYPIDKSSTDLANPEVYDFQAIPSETLPGQKVELHWRTANAQSITILKAKQDLFQTSAPEGFLPVAPRTSTTYELIAENKSGGSATLSVDVHVTNLCVGKSRKVQLRSTPGEFPREQISFMMKNRDFRDHDFNPSGQFANEFERYDEIIVDCATHLMWQRFGSRNKKFTWFDRNEYINQLNARSYGGFSDWRLPTIEELASLIESQPNNEGLYIDSAFESRGDFWSADDWIDLPAGAADVAWSANYSYGGVFHGGAKVNHFYIRAARSID